MNYVLDASAIIALLGAEPGGSLVEDMISVSSNLYFAHAVNLCEVYYDACRRMDAGGVRAAGWRWRP